MDDPPVESTGVKLGRNKSRRRVPQERPRINEDNERILRGNKGRGTDDETPAKVSDTAIRRSKSLFAKAAKGGGAPDGERERTTLSWHTAKLQRKNVGIIRSSATENPTPDDGSTSTESSAFRSPGDDLSQHPKESLSAESGNQDFIQRLVSVIGDIACPVHPDRSIQSCPRECGWHIEHHVERGKSRTDGIGESLVAHSNSSTLVPSSSLTGSRPSSFDSIQIPPIRYSFGVRPCYILILLGLISIAGSLGPAIWRANFQDDLSGGFTLAQYILGVGIFVVGSMVAIHSRTCVCWHS